MQALTFWLRPRFVLRVVNRFQRIAGFDRAIALGSSAFTAVIPLAIVTSAVASALGGQGTADRIIARYHLTGGGADAVEAIFAPASGPSTSLGLVGFFFLLLAVLSFARAMQRLFEQAWELQPLSVRNSLNGLLWIAGLGAFLAVNGLIRAALGRSNLEFTAALIAIPLSAVFLVWTGWVLSARGSRARTSCRSPASRPWRWRCTRSARASTFRASSTRPRRATARSARCSRSSRRCSA